MLFWVVELVWFNVPSKYSEQSMSPAKSSTAVKLKSIVCEDVFVLLSGLFKVIIGGVVSNKV